MLSLMIPDSFLNICIEHGIDPDAAEELTQDFLREFGRFPQRYSEALEVLE